MSHEGPKQSKGEQLISKLFSSRGEFSRRVREALGWSERGGPEVGSSQFTKAVCGEIEFTVEDYSTMNREIYVEVGRIKKERREGEAEVTVVSEDTKAEDGRVFSKEERDRMIDSSRKQCLREARRAGLTEDDIDFDELYS